MKQTLITSKLINLKEENILSATDNLTENYALKTDLKNDLKDLSFSLFE